MSGSERLLGGFRHALPLITLFSLVGCQSPARKPTSRPARPYAAVEPTGEPAPERVAALSGLDPVWMRRSQIANLFDGRRALVRSRRSGSTGPATQENASYLTVTLGNRDGSQGADRDRDGLSDEAEVAIGTNPDAFDTDGDSIPDAFEIFGSGTRAERADSDGDGTPDDRELDLDDLEIYGDRDGDGLRNGQERASFNTNADGTDSDADGFDDIYEYYFWTDMSDSANPDVDTDGDGQPDGFERANGFDPADPNSSEPDADGDALPDFSDENDEQAFAQVPGRRAAVPAGAATSSSAADGHGVN